MENFALIGVAISIGYLIKKLNIFSKDSHTVLNQFLINISLPALILLQIPKLSISIESFIPIIISWSVMTLSAILIFVLSKRFNFSKEITGCLMLVSVLGNTSFIGVPIVTSYLQADALPYLLIYDQVGTCVALTIYGTVVASYYSQNSKITFKTISIKFLTFPPFIALLIGLLFIGSEFNLVITTILGAFADTIVPLALVSVGLQLKLKLLKDEMKPFFTSLGVKLIFAPIIAIVICKIFGWKNTASLVSILEASMPPMITAGAIASLAGLAPKLSSSIVGYGTILSIITSGLFYLIAK